MENEWPLILGTAYADHIGKSLYTVAARVGVHSRFFERLAGSSGCRVDTYNAVMGWFDENWPADLAWPEAVPRPSTRAPKRKRRAA
ncbi:hypothetical protein EGN72_02640 [Pseudorhodobacter sp. E13]|uniref:hypothetical protein n=1 Tax=Pseudorhodobacter sp. E13 TaxID=2487931 RepID=UPI000F8E19C0|nr:hypothetical protein [Pseudorhodobacter sp. E13]RUS64909.1 hypothetical protein EGN72_02640 [Pseudorhodobacter sp. E13]